MDYTNELNDIESTLRALPRVKETKPRVFRRYDFTCECGDTFRAAWTKTGLCKKCLQQGTNSGDPYSHRVQSKPPQTEHAINYRRQKDDRERDEDEDWLGNRPTAYGMHARHNPRYYRQGINAHVDTVRRHYQREQRLDRDYPAYAEMKKCV